MAKCSAKSVNIQLTIDDETYEVIGLGYLHMHYNEAQFIKVVDELLNRETIKLLKDRTKEVAEKLNIEFEEDKWF
jgi:hypothetical protein